ncbi:MAG: Mut7-C RNAse domain-containing protein [Smithellaceae bacterium]
MSATPKFITDAILAKLAKWLRLLGFDTIVFPREAGRDMLNQACAEKRIVLTKRRDMLERQFSGQLYFVSGIDIGSQLNEVITEFSLTIDKKKIFRICLACNEKLFPIAKEEVRDLVPPYVFANCSEYNECPRCLRIYWTGTHLRNALQFLEKLHICLR